MCEPGQQAPSTIATAVEMAEAALRFLAGTDAAAVPAETQASCLRFLERAESIHTAARARFVSTFAAAGGCELDGQGTVRTWLKWQTRVTGGAAAGAVGWARRLAAHPAVAAALESGQLSASWAREICGWTDKLPWASQQEADEILLAAAPSASLADLSSLAEEMYRRLARPDRDHSGFDDRWVSLGVTLGGGGRINGELTPECTAALKAVLESLGQRAGPEDLRSRRQRDHDALAEACRRLVGAGGLPDRAGQPTQIQLHMTLDQLRGLEGASDAEAAWAGFGCPAGPGSDCDASVVPIVSGHLDLAGLTRLAAALAQQGASPAAQPSGQAWQALVAAAADVLSGPSGLAAFLRRSLLDGAARSISLPLDVGRATETIPGHLRRAVILRDRCCRFPGCAQPAVACQVHHIVPRRKGGRTSLRNLVLLCSFHHLIAVHQWGWEIVMDPDGTVTATSPGRSRTLHGSGPPPATAA